MTDLERVSERLRAARRITALTGAGVSAASGIPTFRGENGLWKSIWHVRCWNACERGRADWLDDVVPQPRLPPPCPHCDGIVRPAVVWFGESLDPRDVAAATAACAADVFLTIGTSAIVYPAAGLVHHAKRHGAFTVEINPDETDASREVDVSIRGNAEDVLVAV